MKTNKEDIAGKEYWDNNWSHAEIPGIINPKNRALGNVIDRSLDEFFHKIFDKYFSKTEDKSFIEVGCGNSRFLPYMDKEFGFRVAGLDYSDVGCEMARKTAAYYGITADIILCDLFKPLERLLKKFDVVFSAGVIEHFKDTVKPCCAMAEFVKPGGVIVNIIPNFSPGSITGKIQKKWAVDIYDKHVLLDKKDLIKAHEDAGFEMLYCEYLLGYNGGVFNFGGEHESLRKYYVRVAKLLMLLKRNKIVGKKKYAPYIVYVGRKK